MTLSFLYPLYWLGALAIAAPVWLHLRRKAERSLVRFSAVQFLDDLPQARTSPLRLQNPLLFLLRALALLLLIAAFAWPYLPSGRTEAVSESRIYILDNTLSHRADDGVQRDRQKIINELSKAPADTQIAVIELASLPRVLIDFGEPRADAIARLEKLQPSFERGSYLAAFRQAAALFQKSLGSRHRLELLADSQENQWTEATTVAPFLEGVEVVLPSARSTPRDNFAVAEPRARRLYLGNKSIVECEVKVTRQGLIPSAEIAIEVNGEEVDRRTLKFKDDSPPITSLTFQWETQPRERIVGTIEVRADDDALSVDNRAFFSLPELREGRVTAVTRSPFLRTGLSPAVMQGRWVSTVVDDLDNAAVPSSVRDSEVLLIESHFLLAPAGRELVDYYLKRERGVLVLVDHVAPPVQAYLRSHGVEFRSIVDQPAGAASFRYVSTDHPIFQPFRARDFGNLLDIQVHRYRRLAAPAAHALVYSQHGDMLLAQTDRTQGKLMVAAFGFERADTNWPLHPTFVPFLDLCLEYLRAEPNLQANFEPAERCVWSLPQDHQGDTLVLREGERDVLSAPIQGGRVEFAVPKEPGLYQVSFDGGKTMTHGINVNPSPLESELTYADADVAVETWKIAGSAATAGASSLPVSDDISRSEILRQTTWWWLLLGGVFFLVLEMIWEAIGL